MAGVAWIGIDAEASVNDDMRGRYFNLSCSCVASRTGARLARLTSDISDGAVHGRMNKLSVVLIHDFSVYQGRVFCLLREELFEQEQLDAEQSCEKDGGDDGDGRTRVCSRARQKEPVDKDMARREEGEQFEIEGLGVPDADLPHIVAFVGMLARRSRVGTEDRREISQWRGRRRRVYTHSTGRRRRGRLVNGAFEEAVFARAGEGV